MPLLLLCLFHLYTKNPLHNDGSIILCVIFSKDNTIIFCVFVVLLYIRSANVTTIFCNNICPLTRAIPHHMANPMAAMALNPSGAARGSTLGRLLDTLGWCGRLHCCWCCRRRPRAGGGWCSTRVGEGWFSACCSCSRSWRERNTCTPCVLLLSTSLQFLLCKTSKLETMVDSCIFFIINYILNFTPQTTKEMINFIFCVFLYSTTNHTLLKLSIIFLNRHITLQALS